MGLVEAIITVLNLLTRPGTFLSFLVVILLVIGVILLVVNPFPLICRFYAWRQGVPPLKSHVMRLSYVITTAPGVKLEMEHYFPYIADLSQRQYPTLLSRSPYGISAKHGLVGFFLQVQAYYMASLGYHVLLQNTRSLNSDWGPTEIFDGKRTLQWLKLQPWFNGKLGCFGSAYGGWTQLTLLGKDSPIQPTAIVPAAACGGNWYDCLYFNTAIDLSCLLIYVIGKYQRKDRTLTYVSFEKVKGGRSFDSKIYNMSMHVPLIEADVAYLGEVSPLYRQVLSSPDENDDYWQQSDISSIYENADGDAFHIMTGWYDLSIVGSLKMYSSFVAKGKTPYLTVFNQDHGGQGFQYNWAHLIPWYEHRLKGKKGREHPVQVEVGPGTGQWLYLDSWPPFRTETYLYLQPGAQLDYTPSPSALDYQYTYDPEKPTPYIAGNTAKNGGCVNNLPFLINRQQLFHDILLFTGPPLFAPCTITGNISVTLYVSSSLDHTDFFVRLLDYDPKKNVSLNICDGFLRITPTTQPPKDAAGVFRITVELFPTAYRVAEYHSIMLMISSGAHPFRSRNPGTGEPISTATKFLKAQQRIFVSPTHLSFISLPELLE